MRKLVTRTLAAGALAGTLLAGTVTPALASTTQASTTACKTTRTYSHSVTSAGSDRQTWKIKTACGRNYTLRQWVQYLSYTGSHYVSYEYKRETYPHYYETITKDAFSKAGKETVTYTVKTG